MTDDLWLPFLFLLASMTDDLWLPFLFLLVSMIDDLWLPFLFLLASMTDDIWLLFLFLLASMTDDLWLPFLFLLVSIAVRYVGHSPCPCSPCSHWPLAACYSHLCLSSLLMSGGCDLVCSYVHLFGDLSCWLYKTSPPLSLLGTIFPSFSIHNPSLWKVAWHFKENSITVDTNSICPYQDDKTGLLVSAWEKLFITARGQKLATLAWHVITKLHHPCKPYKKNSTCPSWASFI